MSSDQFLGGMPWLADNIIIVRPEGVTSDKGMVEKIIMDAETL